MEWSLSSIFVVSLLFFIVAFLYSSVGHGGASGYLAILSFIILSPAEMSTTALLLNVVVAGIASFSFIRSGHFLPRLTLPFVVASIPMSFAGGMITVSPAIYAVLLGLALVAASFRLAIRFGPHDRESGERRRPTFSLSLLVGSLIGLLSGIVGIGGGIFLSPLVLLMGWGDAKQTAAASAVFILLNSAAGLLGRAVQHTLAFGNLLPFLLVTVLGGFLGSRAGATRFSNLTLRRILAIVLFIAAMRIFPNFG